MWPRFGLRRLARASCLMETPYATRQPVREIRRSRWPDFRPLFPVPAAPGVIPPSSPFVSIAPNAGQAAADVPVERGLPAGELRATWWWMPPMWGTAAPGG